MRRAFVGLSSPIGFDYRNPATKTKADQQSSPNPILDSPFGLMLLFDEIIFLTRSLCPENMRKLPYVRFLDESERFPEIDSKILESTRNSQYKRSCSSPELFRNKYSFKDAVRNAGVLEEIGVDNHSHSLKIGSYIGGANADIGNLAVDLLFLSKLNDKSIEFITNSKFAPVISPDLDAWGPAKLTELLVVENISNYLTPKGPYHPVIEDVRENQYLKEFRSWVVQQGGLASLSEVKEMKKQVEATIQEAQDQLFLKHLDQRGHFKTIGEAMLGDLAGLVYPIAGTTKAIVEAGIDILKPSTDRWQGFVVGARKQISHGK